MNVLDIDDCIEEPCHNSGQCFDQINSYNCSCTEFWTGQHCEQGKCYQMNASV